MTIVRVQRTLLVGLGEIGARTADLFLVELAHRWGRLGLITGLAVLDEAANLNQIEAQLFISPEAGFESWRGDFETQAALLLRQISQVSHLNRLSRQAISLGQADEIQVIVIANPARPWVRLVLAELTHVLRDVVDRTLACQTGLTGVLLYVEPEAAEKPAEGEAPPEPSIRFPELPGCDRFGPGGPGRVFERGCFVAGLTNEPGLVIGQVDQLIRGAVYFLELLWRARPPGRPDWTGPDAAGWTLTCASFGVATWRWPGRELLPGLSAGWTQAMLTQLTGLPPEEESQIDLARQARQAAQQFLISQKLAPPLLLEALAKPLPLLPLHLAELVPEPPWPWLLKETDRELDAAAQGWQDEWLAGWSSVETTLTELASAWPGEAEAWLRQQTAQAGAAGAVLAAQSHLAAVSELLQLYVAGVEAKLEEAEAGLVAAGRQVGRAVEALSAALVPLPGSAARTLLRWGPRPLRWPGYWLTCRRTQTLARNLAHLRRAQLLAWQNVSYYEASLPFYRDLVSGWGQIVEAWNRICREVVKASQSPALAGWPEQIERTLAASSGPWSEGLVMALYEEAIRQNDRAVWEQAGGLSDWVAGGLEAEQLIERLREQASAALEPILVMPVDQALGRQLPDPQAQAVWLTNLVEQARPFWQYDETMLAEPARVQANLETWLLLPEGEASPLATLTQNWSPPPLILPSPRPDELGVVMLRRIPQTGSGSEPDNDNQPT